MPCSVLRNEELSSFIGKRPPEDLSVGGMVMSEWILGNRVEVVCWMHVVRDRWGISRLAE